jgi:hypothetical protein
VNGSIAVVAILGAIVFLVGCTSNTQIRTDLNQPAADPKKAVIEHASDYELGFVELDDQGWFRDRKQLDAVKEMIRKEAGLGSGEPRGLILLAFVHGWKHNASYDDKNVVTVRSILERLNAAEHDEASNAVPKRPARRVVGVYCGWRGLSATLEPFEELSFWDRKNTAHQVGHGSLTELLSTLEELQIECNKKRPAPAPPRSELILIGHSFGATAMYSALSQIVVSRWVRTIEQGEILKPLGDVIILLNPAFEASRHYNLNDLATTASGFQQGQQPVLAIFTSKGDWATHYVFPMGRFFSTLFESYRGDKLHEEQSKAGREAVGWFTPFRTHNLVYDADAKFQDPSSSTTLQSDGKKPVNQQLDSAKFKKSMSNVRNQRDRWFQRERHAEYSFDDCKLKPESSYKAGNPILVVSVDTKIMKDHDDIGNEVLINFLREFIVFCQTPEK